MQQGHKAPAKSRFCFAKEYATNKSRQSIKHTWRAIFIFLRRNDKDALLVSRGAPQKAYSSDLSQIGVNRGKIFGGFCPGPGGILHPPSGLPLGSPEMGLTTGIRKKLRSMAETSGPLAAGVASRKRSRSRLPQYDYFVEAGIAPRNILHSFQQGSPLVRKKAVDKGRPS